MQYFAAVTKMFHVWYLNVFFSQTVIAGGRQQLTAHVTDIAFSNDMWESFCIGKECRCLLTVATNSIFTHGILVTIGHSIFTAIQQLCAAALH